MGPGDDVVQETVTFGKWSGPELLNSLWNKQRKSLAHEAMEHGGSGWGQSKCCGGRETKMNKLGT